MTPHPASGIVVWPSEIDEALDRRIYRERQFVRAFLAEVLAEVLAEETNELLRLRKQVASRLNLAQAHSDAYLAIAEAVSEFLSQPRALHPQDIASNRFRPKAWALAEMLRPMFPGALQRPPQSGEKCPHGGHWVFVEDAEGYDVRVDCDICRPLRNLVCPEHGIPCVFRDGKSMVYDCPATEEDEPQFEEDEEIPRRSPCGYVASYTL